MNVPLNEKHHKKFNSYLLAENLPPDDNVEGT